MVTGALSCFLGKVKVDVALGRAGSRSVLTPKSIPMYRCR